MSKKQIRNLAIIAAALIVAVAIWCLAAVVQRTVQTPVKTREVPSSPPSIYRIIGEWEGKVAVYVPGTDMPETVCDTLVMSLPEEERQKLYDGIAVDSREMLALRLEDYR